MDTSKEYIKMCDCPEIQNKWKRLMGDWIWDSHWKEAEVLRYDTTKKITDDWREDYSWLPRQDQIQEMLPINNCKCSSCLIVHLSNFVEDNIEGFFDAGIESMEQYWLAFYMSEKHQKFWDSKKEQWIKSE